MTELCTGWALFFGLLIGGIAGLAFGFASRLPRNNTETYDALTWRPAPEVVTEPGWYLYRWEGGLHGACHADLDFKFSTGITHIAGPLPLREGGDS